MSPKLHRVQVPLMSGKECEKRFREAGYKLEIDKTIICAGWPEGGKDACQVKKNGNTSAYCSFYRTGANFFSVVVLAVTNAQPSFVSLNFQASSRFKSRWLFQGRG